jgi:cell division protein FtsI (penicillin-binding protein 3)
MKKGRSLISQTQSGFQWMSESVWKVEHAFERVNADGAKLKNARVRIFGILAGISFCYLILMVFAAKASLFNAIDALGQERRDPTLRAALVDRNGALLAADMDNYRLYLDPTDMIASDRPLVERALAELMPQISREDIDKAFKSKGPRAIATWLKPSDRKRILEAGLPGLSFEVQRLRGYPLGVTGASYIGTTQRGGTGLNGAELAFNDEVLAKSQTGENVELAMDLRVQGALENELRAAASAQDAAGAIGLVTNVRTGEVLAMASWPEYDPNPGRSKPENMKNLGAADRNEVGSIFKMFTVAIGLDTGTATINSVYDATKPLYIGPRRISDFHAENRVLSLEEVFIKSSNIGSARIAQNIGIATMKQYYGELGLLRRADIELREVVNPILPRQWGQNELASTAFGHGMAITALSFAEAAGTVANGGYLRPLTLRKLTAEQSRNEALPQTRVFSANTSRQMLELMRINVIKGTGKRANAPGLRVGGKTGTADKLIDGKYSKNREFASFAAVFPTDGPLDADRYLVLIMVDDPKGPSRQGGSVSAPVAGHVINRIAPFVNVARTTDHFTAEQWDQASIPLENATSGVSGTAVAEVGAGNEH